MENVANVGKEKEKDLKQVKGELWEEHQKQEKLSKEIEAFKEKIKQKIEEKKSLKEKLGELSKNYTDVRSE